MEKEKVLQIAVPAIAVAAIVVVVALIVNGAAPPVANKPGSGTLPPLPPGKETVAQVPANSEGMSLEKPDLNAPEWKDTGEGLKVWDVKLGEGDIGVTPSDEAVWHYTGWRPDGFVFDSSVRKGEPFPTNLLNVVQGWTRGLPGMKVGGIRRLYVPSPLAYGKKGAGREIPPNTDLIFEVKLLRISR